MYGDWYLHAGGLGSKGVHCCLFAGGPVSSCWLLYTPVDAGGVGRSDGFLVWQCVLVWFVGLAGFFCCHWVFVDCNVFCGNSHGWS